MTLQLFYITRNNPPQILAYEKKYWQQFLTGTKPGFYDRKCVSRERSKATGFLSDYQKRKCS